MNALRARPHLPIIFELKKMDPDNKFGIEKALLAIDVDVVLG